jgi:uncharacterized protein YndB with AHSA1/START domain
MLKTIALVVLCILALSVVSILGYAATKPDTFRVARSITIDAPPERVFPLVNDLRANMTWSPFEKDPDMQRTFSAVTAGKGASYAWDGNSDVGAGSVEIVDATAPSKVTMKLDMVRPLEGHNIVEFTLDPGPGADATNVTWAMHGEQPFLGKLMSTFIDCEAMVGGEFEKGLAKLKSLAENQVAQSLR